jgi:hypothetical protein
LFYFIFQVIVVSIVASTLLYALKIVPRKRKWKYALIMELANSVLLTIILSIFIAFDIYPAWFTLFGLVFLTLLISIQITNRVLKNETNTNVEGTEETEL